jgi:DNA-binding IclR family transcriptional regulator
MAMARVRSVERAFDVLSALSAGPLGVTDLADRVGLPKSTVARLLDTLGADAAVEQLAADGRYRLGPAIAALAAAARGGTDLATVARPFLEELATSVGEAAGLSVPEGFAVRYIIQVDVSHEVRVRDWTGTKAPMHAVSSGHVLLAGLSPAKLRAILPPTLERLTPRTITDPGELRRHLRQVRRQGYAWVRDEFADGLSSVAAPIRDTTNRAIAAVHVHGPSYRFPAPGSDTAIGREVVTSAHSITDAVAHAGSDAISRAVVA